LINFNFAQLLKNMNVMIHVIKRRIKWNIFIEMKLKYPQKSLETLFWCFSLCQFHQHFTRAFFVRKFVQCQTLSKEKTFVPKMGEYNVDEIDNWSRFHQYFMRSFYVRRSQKRKKTVKPSVFFDFWDLLENYLSTEHLFYYLESEF